MPTLTNSTTGLPREFLDDLRLTLGENQEAVLDHAIQRMETLLKAGTGMDIEPLAKEIAAATGCAERTAMGVLRFVTFLAMNATQRGAANIAESVRSILASMPSDAALVAGEEERLGAVVEKLERAAKKTEQALWVGRAARGVLPMFQALGGTLELRSTRLPGQAKGEAGEVPLTLIPIASIQLKLDSGTQEAVYFQATEDDLAMLQKQVEELREGLSELKASVQVTPR
jgi:hypothetical protein